MELFEGIDRVNGLLVVHTRNKTRFLMHRRDDAVVASVYGGECHVPPIFSKIVHLDRGGRV